MTGLGLNTEIGMVYIQLIDFDFVLNLGLHNQVRGNDAMGVMNIKPDFTKK